MLDDLNRVVASSGGGWFKLNRIEHGTLKGIVVDVETREKTFEGSVVLSRKTGKPRQERVFTLITDQRDPDDDEQVQQDVADQVQLRGRWHERQRQHRGREHRQQDAVHPTPQGECAADARGHRHSQSGGVKRVTIEA